MSYEPITLVVGADSLVGGSLVEALRAQGVKTLASTRRPDTLHDGRVLLDFESDEPWIVPNGVDRAVVVAAATNYDRCETDPQARVINVELIPLRVKQLLEQGIFVTFISTNSVFGGERPWPAEDAPHDPGIAYAQQKSDGEAVIVKDATQIGALDRLGIVRLTKILEADTSPLPSWIETWREGGTVTPFADLIFAPMSRKFVGEALATIAGKNIAGNLHLSGAENVDYGELAKRLARRIGADETAIEPTTSVEKGVHIAFLPKYSGLGMERTTELAGIHPQPLDAVLADCFEQDMLKKG